MRNLINYLGVYTLDWIVIDFETAGNLSKTLSPFYFFYRDNDSLGDLRY